MQKLWLRRHTRSAVPAKILSPPWTKIVFYLEREVGFNWHFSDGCDILSIPVSQVGGGRLLNKLKSTSVDAFSGMYCRPNTLLQKRKWQSHCCCIKNDMKAEDQRINISFIFQPFYKKSWGWLIKTVLSHEEIPGTVVLTKSRSVVTQGPRFPGGVGSNFFNCRSWGGGGVFVFLLEQLWPIFFDHVKMLIEQLQPVKF